MHKTLLALTKLLLIILLPTTLLLIAFYVSAGIQAQQPDCHISSNILCEPGAYRLQTTLAIGLFMLEILALVLSTSSLKKKIIARQKNRSTLYDALLGSLAVLCTITVVSMMIDKTPRYQTHYIDGNGTHYACSKPILVARLGAKRETGASTATPLNQEEAQQVCRFTGIE